MHLNLRDQQLNHIYIERLLYINLPVTTNQKSIIDTHTGRRKEFKHNTKDSHQITREENKRRKEQKRTTKITSKQFTKWQYVHTYQ